MFMFTDCVIGYEFNGTDCVSYFPNWWIIILCIVGMVTLILILAYIIMKSNLTPKQIKQLNKFKP